jgi:hypothetical protein
MTAADVLGRVDELTGGTGGSVDAVIGNWVHLGNPGLEGTTVYVLAARDSTRGLAACQLGALRK